MSTVVVMVTVSERVSSLNRFLESLAEHEPGRPIFIHLQDPANQRGSIVVPPGVDAEIMVTPEPIGCHAARVLALRALKGAGFDSYINVDDDVTLIDQTRWQPAIDKTAEPGVGFVLTNWIKHRNGLEKAVKIMEDRFYPAVFVYNGGGMAYSNEVADLIRTLEPVPSRYDDIWPLTTYLAGYNNYRYRGSLSIHAIMSKGGMNTYMAAEPRPLLCWEWVNYRQLYGHKVGSDWAIPADRDLKQIARDTHAKAREHRGWS